MESLSKQDREKALKAVMFLCMRQLQGTAPEEQGVHELGFGSVEAMRIQLAHWGLPDWLSGAASEEGVSGNKPKARRSGGEAEQLPNAEDAAHFFKAALSLLQEDIDSLRKRRDYLRDGRFVAEHHYAAEDGESWKTWVWV